MRVLLALGGNAMTAADGSASPTDQRAAIEQAMESVADLIGWGSTILTTADVMPGVGAMMHILQVVCVFPDGTKLVTVHHPIP